MRNLSDFSLPPLGQNCLGELDGRPCYQDENLAKLDSLLLSSEKPTNLHITSDIIQPLSVKDERRALFLPVDVPFLKQLTQVYYEHGFIETLHTAEQHHNKAISSIASLLLKMMNSFEKINIFKTPLTKQQEVDLIQEYNETRNWSSSLIRCLSWNPYSSKLAVCTIDDVVRIYTNDTNATYLLRCREQKNVSCLAWRPLTNFEIAIGHGNGIIIWSIDPHSLVHRPSSSNATILHKINHKPVVSLTWDSRGDLLVSAAACDKLIYVWNVELNKTNVLKRPISSGNTIVKWSPSGNKMFSASNGIVFRVWKCQSWQSEKWTLLNGRVQTACWSDCGNFLFFATSTEPLIYLLKVKDEFIFTSDNQSSNDQAIPIFDLTKMEINDVTIGGLVQSMVMDPKGQNLAVMFKNTNAVAVFYVAKKQIAEIFPSSIIVGNGEEIPSNITFQQNCKTGACLTIGWSSGRIQHFPILYTDLVNNTRDIQVNSFANNLHKSF